MFWIRLTAEVLMFAGTGWLIYDIVAELLFDYDETED